MMRLSMFLVTALLLASGACSDDESKPRHLLEISGTGGGFSVLPRSEAFSSSPAKIISGRSLDVGRRVAVSSSEWPHPVDHHNRTDSLVDPLPSASQSYESSQRNPSTGISASPFPASSASPGGFSFPVDPHCHGVRNLTDFHEQCLYVTHHPSCSANSSWLPYLRLYYCRPTQPERIAVGVLLLFWLGSLFFMLGNTAADFFCPSLEQLSRLLHLPPTIAGVTLLPLGNGAPDVFASIAAFVGTGQGQVGLNSVLGAATFVSSVVAGLVCLAGVGAASLAARRGGSSRRLAASPAAQLQAAAHVTVDGPSFLRDSLFYMAAVLILLLLICLRQVHLVAALAFTGIYLAYCVAVASFLCCPQAPQRLARPLLSLLSSSSSSRAPPRPQSFQSLDFLHPLLSEDDVSDGAELPQASPGGEAGHGGGSEGEDAEGGTGGKMLRRLPQWMWTRRAQIFQLEHTVGGERGQGGERGGAGAFMEVERGGRGEEGGAEEEEDDELEDLRPLWGWGAEEEEEGPKMEHAWSPPKAHPLSPAGLWFWLVRLPATLPRLLTIPLIPHDRSSRPIALLSLLLAPPFFLLTVTGIPSVQSLLVSIAVGLVLCLLGCLAAFGAGGPERMLQRIKDAGRKGEAERGAGGSNRRSHRMGLLDGSGSSSRNGSFSSAGPGAPDAAAAATATGAAAAAAAAAAAKGFAGDGVASPHVAAPLDDVFGSEPPHSSLRLLSSSSSSSSSKQRKRALLHRVTAHLTGLLFLLPGFVMSIVWFYAIANELVALLVAAAVVLHVRSSILGLTLLAWGNSVGDLVANLALAFTGGREGVQIAWSGCFAGPMFNMLVGLGASLVLSCARTYPAAFVIPEDPTLPWTLLFLLLSLLISLGGLCCSGFRLSRPLGASLLLVYLAFFGVRLLDLLGVAPLPSWWHK